MATLTSSYQYLGRSSAMPAQNGNFSYYLLLYGKTSANQATGIHTVTIKSVLASPTNNATFYKYATTFNGKINGTTAFSGTKKPDAAWNHTDFTEGGVTYKEGTIIGEGSVSVDCSDGLSKDISLSAYWKFTAAGATYTPAQNTERTVSVTATLPAIARKATLLTATNFSEQVNPTITYSLPAGTSVTSIQAGIYDSTGLTPYVRYREISTTDTSYTFPLTAAEKETLMTACGDSNALSVKFYLKTTMGGNTFLSEPLARTFSITNGNPIITASVVCDDATFALTGVRNKLIKYYSSATATMSAEAQAGAAIDENLYIIRNGDQTGYGAEHTFENVESNIFTFSAEDSRGNVGVSSVELTLIDYIKLTCHIADYRPDALGHMTVACVGNYFKGSFGTVENTLQVQYRYTVTGNAFSDNWVDMDIIDLGSEYYASAEFDIPDFEQGTSYSFETRAIDKLYTVTSSESKVKSIPLFHWGENDFVFEVPVTFNAGATGATAPDTIEGDLKVTGNLRLKGNANYGNTLMFGDGTYCYISESEDDVMYINADRGIHLTSSAGVYVDGYPIPILDKGIWSPSLDSSAISSYTTQYGWYMKMGQTVTVGFLIKATCKSGYNGVGISIYGLPFKPMFSAAGGGMCSGAYISGGNNFQCFVAETSGYITARVQACNNASAANLSTSASGCFYRSGGGELTLSGTITFMANS